MYINFNYTVSGKKDTPVYIVTLQRLVSFVWNCTHANYKNNQQELGITLKKYTWTSVLLPFILRHWKYDKFDKVIAKTSGYRFFSRHSIVKIYIHHT